MGGFRINAVRAALQIMLRSLPTKDTSFNIWSFGSRHSSLWPTSKVYSATSVKEATAHIDTIDSNYGGTEIEAALNAVYKSTKSSDAAADKVPTSVFVLTDGEAWNLEGVLQTVRSATMAAKADKNILRSFVLGVGDDVSTPMCEGIARAGKGIAVFVGNNEKPDAKLMGLLKAARSAVIEDLAVDWGATEPKPAAEPADLEEDDDFEVIDQPKASTATPVAPISLFDEAPKPTEAVVALGPGKVVVNLGPPPRIQQAPELDKLPIPLYPGFRTSIFAIIKRDQSEVRPTSIKITGKVLGIPVTLEVPVTAAAPTPLTKLAGKNHGILHVLAARALIQGFQDQPTSEENVAKIVRLGTRYSLASSQTSFVAVDDDGDIKNEPIASVEEAKDELAMDRQKIGSSSDMKKMKMARPTAAPVLSAVARPMSARQSSLSAPGSAPSLTPTLQSARYSAAAPPPPPSRRPAAAAPPPPLMSRAKALSALPPSAPRPTGAATSSTPPPPPPPPPAKPRSQRESATKSKSSSAVRKSSTASAAPVAPSVPTVESFAREQDFEGFFPSSALEGVFPNGVPPKPASLDSLSTPEEQKNNIWCSILVLAYLEKMFASDKVSWDFFAEKALDYIKDAIPQDAHASIAEWKEQAGTYF